MGCGRARNWIGRRSASHRAVLWYGGYPAYPYGYGGYGYPDYAYGYGYPGYYDYGYQVYPRCYYRGYVRVCH